MYRVQHPTFPLVVSGDSIGSLKSLSRQESVACAAVRALHPPNMQCGPLPLVIDALVIFVTRLRAGMLWNV